MKTIIKHLLLFVIASQFLSAQAGLTNTQREIIGIVSAADGKITQALHDEFWGNVREEEKAILEKRFLPFLRNQLITASEYQMETWKSAKISYALREPVLTLRMLKLENDYFEKAKDHPSLKKDSSAYQVYWKNFRESFEQSSKNSRDIIQSAAKHEPYGTEFKGMIEFNDELFDIILSNSSGTIERMSKLLDPKWK